MHQYRCKNDIYNFFKKSEVFNLVFSFSSLYKNSGQESALFSTNLVLTVHNSVFFNLFILEKVTCWTRSLNFQNMQVPKCYA